MTRYAVLIATLVFAFLAGGSAFAACPVNVPVGGTWCENHYNWKCEKCGSELCPIMQPGKCYKGDERFDVTDASRMIKRTNASQQYGPAYSQRP